MFDIGPGKQAWASAIHDGPVIQSKELVTANGIISDDTAIKGMSATDPVLGRNYYTRVLAH
jgi:hypothetical protein